MPKIAIISSSIRYGRLSHRVAVYINNLIREQGLAESEILDLRRYNFPLFTERLKFQNDPLPEAIEFGEKVKAADGIIIVTPEYNGGYPASLKNAIDLLTGEWRRKPVAFVPVSDGAFAGSQVITSLQFTLWKIGALTVPGPLRIPDVGNTFDEAGNPADKPGMDKRASGLVKELLLFIESGRKLLH